MNAWTRARGLSGVEQNRKPRADGDAGDHQHDDGDYHSGSHGRHADFETPNEVNQSSLEPDRSRSSAEQQAWESQPQGSRRFTSQSDQRPTRRYGPHPVRPALLHKSATQGAPRVRKRATEEHVRAALHWPRRAAVSALVRPSRAHPSHRPWVLCPLSRAIIKRGRVLQSPVLGSIPASRSRR
jgi:hypothetical protein